MTPDSQKDSRIQSDGYAARPRFAVDEVVVISIQRRWSFYQAFIAKPTALTLAIATFLLWLFPLLMEIVTSVFQAEGQAVLARGIWWPWPEWILGALLALNLATALFLLVQYFRYPFVNSVHLSRYLPFLCIELALITVEIMVSLGSCCSEMEVRGLWLQTRKF